MTNPDNEGGLLPCPFCGGEAQLADGECGIRGMPMNWRNPRCTRCGCDLGYSHHIDAAERWNRRNVELCRAAPAGGEVAAERCGAPNDGRTCYPECGCDTEQDCEYGTKPVSAPAGSGAVEALMKKCDSVLNDMRPISPCLTEQMEGYLADIAALLRKLQQGAESPNSVAKRKRVEIEALGYVCNGVSFMHPDTGRRGLLDDLGAVHWIASQGQEGGANG